MKLSPKVFIIVLNYNGKEVLKTCLLSLLEVEYPNLEVVLVDNNSSDGSFEEARRDFSRMNFIKNEENIGFAAGNNVGIKFALDRGADYVLLLNQDTKVFPDFLSKLVTAAEEDKTIGIVNPLVFGMTEKEIWFSGGKISWLKMKAYHDHDERSGGFYETEFLSGCSILMKKEVFAKIGLWDEDFFLYWEDADFSLRARKAGFRIGIVPESHIFHFEKIAQPKASKVYWLVLSGLIFFKKNTPAIFLPWVKIYFFLRQIKNKLDNRFRKSPISEAVARAYADFKKYGQS